MDKFIQKKIMPLKYKKFITPILLVVAIFLYLGITLPAIFDTNHVMKNLEPYPDGILFSLSARNFSLNKGLILITSWGEIPLWVPPLYSWYLAIFYFISSSVTSFYFANLFLGLGTIFLIYLIIKKTTNNTISLIVGLSIYFSHLVIFWLPSLPMTENFSLFLFSLLILGLVEKKLKLKLLLVFSASVGLLLLRFSTFPIILASLFIILIELKNKLVIYSKQIIFLLITTALASIYLFQIELFSNLKTEIFIAITNSKYFNISFIYPNFIHYSKALLFHQGNFLWIRIGVSNWPIFGLFLYSIYSLYKLKKFNKFYLLITIFFFLLPLQLLFYTFDSRYLIYLIILFSLSGAWLINEIKNKKIIFLIFIAIISNILFQKNFLKQIIADNWLKKSTAWQYEAILHFNNYLSEDKMIITSLPPFLVDAYQTKNYRTLPLSKSQEFLQKEKFVWGTDINYDDLLKNYDEWLNQGKELYISNAYITHQQSVITDFEKFKNEFELKLVSEGCLQACNIYKLELQK